MALTGELSDLSLAELIEFFCNQRKTGCIEVKYTTGSAAFFLQAGAVIHAEVGTLRGIEAVYFALTQTNASFTFNSAIEAPVHTINQPWTSVVLEGLRRMDEGIAPPNPFPAGVLRPTLQEPVKDQPIAGLVEEPVKEQPIAVEAAEVIDAEPPLVSAFDEPQVESIDVLDSEPEPVVSAPKEVPPASVPIIEAYPRPIVAARQEVTTVPAPVVEVKAKPIVSAPKPAAPAPAMHQAAQANSVPAEQKQQVQKKEKPIDSAALDVEPAGILSYHSKPAPPKVSPIFAESASSGFSFGPWKLGAIFAAVVLVIAVVAVPWGWYARSKAAKVSSDTQKVTTDAPQPPVAVNSTQDSQTQSGAGNQAASPSQTSVTETNNVPAVGSDTRQVAPRDVRPKPKNTELALAALQPPAASSNQPTTTQTPAVNAARKVTVQVTYDENGRVTQASGGDATALRIARQKRFPAGKSGSATITIPIN
jgi:hypothetical protein